MRRYKLSASNIAWDKADDKAVYAAMQAAGFTGVEIAPTRVFPSAPYDGLAAAAAFAGQLRAEYGFAIPSLQSIWYGQTGSIFDAEQAKDLLAYTDKAYKFSAAVGCKSLVFGCPKNRMLPQNFAGLTENEKAAYLKKADEFFAEAGRRAADHGVKLAIEANPPIYTNFLNGTAEAFALVKRLGGRGLAVNFDLAAVIANGEDLQSFAGDIKYASHVHISEPNLAPIQRRAQHAELAAMLEKAGYEGYVSIEMRRPDDGLKTVLGAIEYVAEVFA